MHWPGESLLNGHKLEANSVLHMNVDVDHVHVRTPFETINRMLIRRWASVISR